MNALKKIFTATVITSDLRQKQNNYCFPLHTIVLSIPSFVLTFREALLDISKIGSMLNLTGTMP